MAFEIRPHPDFSWSQSRRSTFRECPRKYYWQYYGSHNGWLDEATDEARRAWRLKKITNLYMVLGTIVHELAADTILRAARRGVNQRFVPWRWSLVALALLSIPSFLFRRLNI